MSLAQQLSQLRPLMIPAEIEALLGPEEKKRALDMFSGFQRTTGVSVNFSHADGVIDSILYSAMFPRDVAVCGVQIGMTVDALRKALPDLRLADGQTGKPDEHGFIRYQVKPAALNVRIDISIKNGEVYSFSLYRVDLDEAWARRQRQEAERRAGTDRKRELANIWKSVENADEMLLSWAEHCSPWTDDPPQKFVRFARWLMTTSDPDVWHIVATSWNWDYSHAPLLWIIRQEKCDIATTLKIFFLADPIYYFRWAKDRSSVPPRNLEMFDFLAELRQRLARGFYQRSEIAFDGEEHMSYINRALQTPDDRALAESFFPLKAGQKIPGRDLKDSKDDKFGECRAMLATVN
ncbi:DUF4274 domain-containing protein [Bradyrhizobium sp. GCM10027634]|uniref:DUF4274 domain-containing protein n=1 Tax=unclassified Bradyrhizobium TaxID=2631580 RepID=UPI00263B9436|nr:DUF4274 domain-containing protein [Bradyrhizobium sp. WYCCWR 12677]MDN5004278.1 DUF4274 domain-containing protein [Bradyrhizobium sp. WYCCWR 12677]